MSKSGAEGSEEQVKAMKAAIEELRIQAESANQCGFYGTERQLTKIADEAAAELEALSSAEEPMKDELRRLIEKWREREDESQNGTAWHDAREHCADELKSLLARAEEPEQTARERWCVSVFSTEDAKRNYESGLWPVAEFLVDGGNKRSIMLWGPSEFVDSHSTEDIATLIARLLDRAEGKEPTK